MTIHRVIVVSGFSHVLRCLLNSRLRHARVVCKYVSVVYNNVKTSDHDRASNLSVAHLTLKTDENQLI